MTFAEVREFIAGVRESKIEQLRNTRKIMWAIFNAAPFSKKRFKETDFFTLPGEETRTAPRCGMTEREYREQIAKYRRIMKKTA